MSIIIQMLVISASLNSCRSSPPFKLPIVGDSIRQGVIIIVITPLSVLYLNCDKTKVMGEREEEKE